MVRLKKAFMVLLCLSFGKSFAVMNEPELEDYEDQIEQAAPFENSLFQGLGSILKVQQPDHMAKEVKPSDDLDDYKKAVLDPFYGYQIFVLIDKSKSKGPSRARDGRVRQPQTMYIYSREGNILKFHSVKAISTGRELSPNKHDTREGFMRIQNAQPKYTSKTYGEPMPFSLWFESEYGTAIHETTQSQCDRKIGRRASAGCIRLCPGDAEEVFDYLSKSFPRSSPIVLLDKPSGIPIAKGQNVRISRALNSYGEYLSLPKVIRGYPVFVRIIDGSNQRKIEEIENLIRNPTEEFQRYFPRISNEAWSQLTI